MKKRRNNLLYAIFGIASSVCGSFALVFGLSDGFADLQFTDTTKLFLKIGGVLGLALGLGLLILWLLRTAKDEKEIQINEKDERNIAIRGKAAEMTCMITCFVLSAILVVSFIIESSVTSLLITFVLIVQLVLQPAFIRYYSKKM